MTYSELLWTLYRAGFTRVERDDRLLDIFPAEDREKGVELWERWGSERVDILRVRLPYEVSTLELYAFPRTTLAAALLKGTEHALADFPISATGAAAARHLT